MSEMKVELVRHMETTPAMIASIAGICRGEDNMTPSIKRYVHCLKRGHQSVLRHTCFTFHVSGVTKRMTHQLVRHGYIGVTQQSSMWVPSNEEETALIGTGNLQAWREFLEQRLCRHAHKEIKKLACMLFDHFYALDPMYMIYLKGNKGRCDACRQCSVFDIRPENFVTPPKAILLSGKMRSGKTTVSEIMQAAGSNIFPQKFAAVLYRIHNALEEPGTKNRPLLQHTGQIIREEVDLDIWARVLARKIYRGDKTAIYVVDDLRYVNEINVMKSYLGEEFVEHVHVDCPRDVRAERGVLENEDHISELDADKLKEVADYVITNDNGLEQLTEDVTKLIKFISDKRGI